jgi:hypothetical protein
MRFITVGNIRFKGGELFEGDAASGLLTTTHYIHRLFSQSEALDCTSHSFRFVPRCDLDHRQSGGKEIPLGVRPSCLGL